VTDRSVRADTESSSIWLPRDAFFSVWKSHRTLIRDSVARRA
jgi:hypothetical protein